MAENSTTAVPAPSTPAANDAVPSKTEVANKGDSAPGAGNGLLDTVKRYIPGLAPTDQAAPAASKSKRSRNRGAGSKKAIAGAQDPALATALTEEAPQKDELPDNLVQGAGETQQKKQRPAALNGSSNTISGAQELNADEIAALDKKNSSVQAVQKRLRATGKKLQRIQAYEAQTEALNADQKKALTTKPTLEAVQKELQELLKILEDEEKDDEKRAEKKKAYDERQVQARVASAVNNAKISTQNDLTLLLQFLHLYSLFNPSNSGIMPPTLPAVVQNATGQQHAAVHALFHNLANGPLFGGHGGSDSGDATEQIKSLQSGSEAHVIEGVSFADIKQMILDLTAPPAEVGHELPASESAGGQGILAADEASGTAPVAVGSSLPDQDQQPPLVNTQQQSSSLNFMQASELGGQPTTTNGAGLPDSSVQPSAPVTADDESHAKAIEAVSAATTPGFGAPTPVGESAPQGSGWDAPSGLAQGSVPSGADWDQVTSAPIKNWADDVDDVHPADPFTATADVPSELAGQPQQDPAAVDSTITPEAAVDAGAGLGNTATTTEGGRGGRGRGRGRGNRGRGEGYRGGRGRSAGDWTSSNPRQIRDPSDAAQAVIRAAESRQPDADGFITAGSAKRTYSGTGGNNGNANRGGNRGRGEGYRGSRGTGERGTGSGRGRGEGFRGRGGPRGERKEGSASAEAATPAAAAPAQS